MFVRALLLPSFFLPSPLSMPRKQTRSANWESLDKPWQSSRYA